MSNIIPPLLSDTPPPPPDIDDHDDDEFGDFTGANNLSDDCEDFSPPASPLKLPIDLPTPETLDPIQTIHKSQIFDINSNSKENVIFSTPIDKEKDFQDKRKELGSTIDNSEPTSSIEEALETQGLQTSITDDAGSKEETADDKLNEEENETNCDNIPTFNQNEIEASLDNNQQISVDNNATDNTCDLNFCSEEDKSKQFSLFGNKFSIHETSPSRALDESKLTDIQVDNEDIADDDDGYINIIESDSGSQLDLHSSSLDIDFRNGASDLDNKTDDFDDFGDFASISSSNAKVITFSAVQATNVDINKEDFGDFATDWEQDAEFGAFTEVQPQKQIDDDDDFGDFAESAAPSIPVETSSNPKTESKFLLLNEKEAFDKCTEIITLMFPPLGQSGDDYQSRDLVVNDKIFDQIKNVTDTHALSYQWAKSSSQNMLLKALNIDSRNILFGPGWNPSMPRFAANLSFTPLQPVKTEILTPTPGKETISTSSSQSSAAPTLDVMAEVDVPGAINPLQNKEPPEPAELPNKETKQPKELFATAPTVVHRSNPLTQPLRIEPKPKSVVTDDFDDFVSYSNPPGHSVLLRETHISNKEPTKIEETDIVNWLEPTIVTPELTRKERTFEPEDMDEFQMVVESIDPNLKVSTLTVKPVEVLAPLPIQPTSARKSSLDLDLLEDFNKRDKKRVDEQIKTAEDDFGDFTYSLPNQSGKNNIADASSKTTTPSNNMTTIKPLTPNTILEPLKPAKLPSEASGAISWPDPGVTDDEISRFEALGFARSQNKIEVEKPQNNVKSRKGSVEAKKNSVDDEEWSDFVSVQNQSPVHKLKQEKERSSTPDLPLSVLNLGSVQPAKQPIPVITPNGLVQTKLSSNMTLNLPLLQPTNRVYPQQVQNTPVFQPSLISNQFATQSFNNYSNYGGYKAPAEEDEWSDFVSHQSGAKSGKTQQNQFTNWVNGSNMIANPLSSINGSSAPSAHKQSNKVVSSANINGTTSTPVPDLSFLTPRNRTSQRK